jgi:RNA polymerase sigma factor (sigma-70 family)
MEELRNWVLQARQGDLESYGKIVRRFQDMAYGYAYSLLSDFHLAEDAAQEAFIEAYRNLADLRTPEAFPGWFRKIIFKQCDRISRRKRPQDLSPQAEGRLSSREPDPGDILTKKEIAESVLRAIQTLPEPERTVTTLFYINGYSQNEIADFLEVPATTVNNRLHKSREQLRERMMNMVADEMKSHPLPEQFPERIRLLLEMPRLLEIPGHPVRESWDIFRAHFHDAEVVQLDEMHPRATFMQDDAKWRHSIFNVDQQRMLRIDLTTQLVDLWLRRGKPACRWLACGRVFRSDKPDTRHLEVFHQAEMLWCGNDVDEQRGEKELREAGARLLPGQTIRRGSPLSYTPVKDAHYWEAQWRGEWFGVAGGGPFDAAWLRSVGVAEGAMIGYGFAFGLERCAQIRCGIDDIRRLWQPPYVTK